MLPTYFFQSYFPLNNTQKMPKYKSVYYIRTALHRYLKKKHSEDNSEILKKSEYSTKIDPPAAIAKKNHN